jgi:tetratricopeptide (TPR) repeat protein
VDAKAILATLLLGITLAEPAFAAAPPARWTKEQRDLLRQRERLWRQMGQQANAGKLDEAATLCARVLRLQQQLFGDHHVVLADTFRLLARIEEARGRTEAAIRASREVAAIVTRLHREGHWKALDARLALADTQMRARLTAEQRQTLERAEQLNEQAASLFEQGKTAAGLPLAQQALRLTKEILGEKHPRYASSLSNLDRLHMDLGEYSKALPLLQQALRLRKETLGEKHPLYAHSLNNLAFLYQDMGEHTLALPLLQQAVRLLKETMGEKHRLYAASLNNLAALYKVRGELSKALSLYQQAVRLLEEALGNRHPQYATSLNNLAALYKALPLASTQGR